MPNEERIDLVVSAQTNDAQKNLTGLVKSIDGLGGTFNDMQKQSEKGASGLGGLVNIAKQFFGSAAMGKGNIAGLVSVIGAINPVAGAALGGILKLAGGLTQFAKESVAVVSQAQTLVINLEALAAQELVKAGKFENAADAMDTAKVAAADLLRQIQLLGLESPFENSMVVQTFRMGMAYGFNADQAMRLTRASLDMAAGLGKSSNEMMMIGWVMGQIRSTGKLLTQDLRQLQSRGINLADMLKTQLGVSVEQFNAGLASGTYTMDDLLDVFEKFAATNFAGAGKRMARTFQGIQSTLKDLKETAYITLLKQPFDQITAVMADALGILQDFVVESGILEKVGARLNALTGKIAAFAGKGLSAVRYWITTVLSGDYLNDFLADIPEGLRGAFQNVGKFIADLRPILSDAAMWARMIWANIRQIGNAVWQYVKPALDWLAGAVAGFDWSPILVHLRDTVNAVGQIIYSLVETIRRVLTGNADTAMDPLRQAITYVLTWIMLTWDRFAAGAVIWGWNLVVQIANGIINAAKSVLQTAMTFVGNLIGLFIKPGSPPKKGPLSHIVEWGQGLINTYVQAFKTADFGLLQDALSPIKAALQDAVAAGNLDEAEFPTLFAGVRDDVAQLIAVFRETGEISDDVLGGIAAKLGEGGTELTKYLRLQLQFQRAQDNLASIGEEVAAAQAAGFVPQELAQRLKAAQAQADAAKDELDWQREYLSLQQESVDLQLELVRALQKMSGALGDVAEKLKAAAGDGAMTPTVTPFTTNLLDGLGGAGVGDLPEDLTALQSAIGGVSEEFQNAQLKVEAWLDLPIGEQLRSLAEGLAKSVGLGGQFQWLETFIDLPIGTKLSYIKNKLEDLVGIDFDALKDITLKDIVEQLQDWTGIDLSGITEFLSTLSEEGIVEFGANLLSSLWEGLIANLPTFMARVSVFFSNLVTNIVTFMVQNAPTFGQKLGSAFGQIVGFMFNLITTKIPAFVVKVAAGLVILIGAVARWLVTEAPRLVVSWVKGFYAMVLVFIDTIVREGPRWVSGLIKFTKAFLSSFVDGFLKNAPDWMKDLVAFGVVLLATLKGGIAEFWDMTEHLRTVIAEWVAQVLLRIGTWLRDLMDIGKTLVQKVKDGIERAWDLVLWLAAKFVALVTSLKEKAGTIFSGLLDLGAMLVGKVKQGIVDAWDMIVFFAGLFSDLFVKLLSPEHNAWLSEILNIGRTIIEWIKTGILGAWNAFHDWFWNLLRSLGVGGDGGGNTPQTALPQNSASTVTGFADTLTTTTALFSDLLGMIDGGTVSLEAMNAKLRGQLAETRRLLNAAGIGLNVSQQYTFGDLVFPNVKDGRDAQGIERTLSRLTLQGRLTAKTTGA